MKKIFFYSHIFLTLIFSQNSFSQMKIEKYELGKSLFFDKLLSGKKNISCASCHHPLTGTSDALSLGLGEGALGLGMSRVDIYKNIKNRIPRNSPSLWNAGHPLKKRYFHDGRVEMAEGFPKNFKTPANQDLPEGVENLLAAQALFPITSPEEMAGHGNESDISIQAAKKNWAGEDGVWRIIEIRLQSFPKYVDAFKKAYPNEVTSKEDIKIEHYANAISLFQKETFKSFQSPYDQFLQGNAAALNERQRIGHEIFNGKGKCMSCHKAPLFTDDQFYSLGFPQIGPGKGDGRSGVEDLGRFKVTGDKKDLFKFITPT
ncbi:MAG: cytochrome-c peroxidase [Halobacteriovoraceae bacterium]|nr:cytochrome-c peroxidase [Halobacteriovoraceae bacterium]